MARSAVAASPEGGGEPVGARGDEDGLREDERRDREGARLVGHRGQGAEEAVVPEHGPGRRR